jgi:hypothetical protein
MHEGSRLGAANREERHTAVQEGHWNMPTTAGRGALDLGTDFRPTARTSAREAIFRRQCSERAKVLEATMCDTQAGVPSA